MTSSANLGKDRLLRAYRQMKLIREFEERLHVEIATGEIPGFTHLYAGQEAVAVGVCEQLSDGDYIVSTHRGHGHCIAKGCDVLGMMKEQLIAPDVLVRLAAIRGLDRVRTEKSGVSIGGQITLDALSRDPTIRKQYTVLAEAAESVATPQIRNVGTLAGNVCQRPWCWYYRNGFKCFKAGGNT